MTKQLALFAPPQSEHRPEIVGPGQVDSTEEWPRGTWRFGADRSIELRCPEPTVPAPPAVSGGEWIWNPLVLAWRLEYPSPPFPLEPRSVVADRHGPKLLPPVGFLEIERIRLAGRCPHCRESGGCCWGGPGWHGWHDPRVSAAFETEETAGRRCYGLTLVDVPGLGRIQPLTHSSRWGAGYCSSCGAVSWNDFREPSSSYYKPPVLRAAAWEGCLESGRSGSR